MLFILIAQEEKKSYDIFKLRAILTILMTISEDNVSHRILLISIYIDLV